MKKWLHDGVNILGGSTTKAFAKEELFLQDQRVCKSKEANITFPIRYRLKYYKVLIKILIGKNWVLYKRPPPGNSFRPKTNNFVHGW